MVLPKREIHTSKELFKSFPELRNVFVDGTERPTQKPKDKDKQKENYSGKKKRHMRKNIVMSDENKRIMPKKKPRGKELTESEKTKNKF